MQARLVLNINYNYETATNAAVQAQLTKAAEALADQGLLEDGDLIVEEVTHEVEIWPSKEYFVEYRDAASTPSNVIINIIHCETVEEAEGRASSLRAAGHTILGLWHRVWECFDGPSDNIGNVRITDTGFDL
ncbi:MAG: hypothetical protein KDB07_06625 [Planctomycetes bacterium]|nr:hypothetical protein [Planctomycetota bacterium]